MKTIKSALISVYHKEQLEPILKELKRLDVAIYSTGGTQKYIEEQGVEVQAVEEVTGYPSILGGRVKTLHPKVFGGILARQQEQNDADQLTEYDIPTFDLVIVDLYPFEQTLREALSGNGKKVNEEDIIEKIDIGGISLIRAAAKNYKDVLVIPSREDYDQLLKLLKEKEGKTSKEDRKKLAAKAFHIASHYDTVIFNYFNESKQPAFKQSIYGGKELRYGENPHQKGIFYGELEEQFEKLNGKALSFNNLVDVDGAVSIIDEFHDEPGCTFAVIKHTNACGIANRETVKEAWDAALAGDPKSAFGGIFICNKTIDLPTAKSINKLFYEVLIAPDFEKDALEELTRKKKRIILKRKKAPLQSNTNLEQGGQFKTILNGVIAQDKDTKKEQNSDLETVTKKNPTDREIADLLFANRVVKQLKSNAIALVKNKQLVGSGMGQTSRVDALEQAITKAKNFDLPLEGAVMASDAFFPFADSVETADKAGITAVIQPGGSIRDQDSIDYCDENDLAMVFTGIRHFKH